MYLVNPINNILHGRPCTVVNGIDKKVCNPLLAGVSKWAVAVQCSFTALTVQNLNISISWHANGQNLIEKCTPGIFMICSRYMGSWPSVRSRWLDNGKVLYFCVFVDLDVHVVKVNKLAKKRTRPVSSHLDQTSMVNKGYIIWLLGKSFLWDMACAVIGYPSGQDGAILPAWDYPLHPASKISPKAI